MVVIEPLFLLVAYLLSPFSLGWASRFASGVLRGFLTGLALALLAVWGYFVVGYFGRSLLVQSPALEISSLIGSVFLLIPGWGLFQWAGSLAEVEEKSKVDVYQRIKTELAPLLSQLGQRMKEAESSVERVTSSLNKRHTEVSALIGQLDKGVSELVIRLEDFQGRLERMHGEVLEHIKEFKAPQEAIPKAGEINHARVPALSEGPAFTPRKLTREEGLEARLSGEAWQEKSVEFFRGLGLEVLNNLKHTKPDHILYRPRTKGPVAVVAVKSYKLLPYAPTDHRHTSPQRTITPVLISAEFKAAKRQKTALIIEVVNKVTDTMWFYIVPHRQLDSFCRVTTPPWLAQNPPPNDKLEENHRQLIHFLKGTLT